MGPKWLSQKKQMVFLDASFYQITTEKGWKSPDFTGFLLEFYAKVQWLETKNPGTWLTNKHQVGPMIWQGGAKWLCDVFVHHKLCFFTRNWELNLCWPIKTLNPKPSLAITGLYEANIQLDRLEPEVMAGLIAAGLDGLQQNMNLPAERQSKEQQKSNDTWGTWSDQVYFYMKQVAKAGKDFEVTKIWKS